MKFHTRIFDRVKWWVLGSIYKVRMFLNPQKKLTLHSLKRTQWYDPDTLIIHAVFQILVNHVENDLSRMEALTTAQYSPWVRFQVRWLPKVFRSKLSKMLGIHHLDRAELPAAGAAERIKSLYLWYVNELPLMKSPFHTLPEPEYHYVDPDGNPTNTMFSGTDKDGLLMLNKFHPEYITYVENASTIETNQRNIINQKLRELMEIREYLWV